VGDDRQDQSIDKVGEVITWPYVRSSLVGGRVRALAEHATHVYVGYMNDVPACRVMSYDCRVDGEDLWVGEVCAHVWVYRGFVWVLFFGFIINLVVYGAPNGCQLIG
jgi:hypothetical protein